VIEVIKDYIDKNYCTEIRLSMFREKYFFSKEYLSKRFKQKYGVGIYEYALKLRMERAKELLMNDDLQIQEISERLGYSNNNYFSKAFKNYYGLSPTDFREKIQSMPDN
jgi:two-component system response regulator YesN